MTPNFTLPRLLKEPTGWLLIVLTMGFFYAQWPSRTPTRVEPVYYWQQFDGGLKIRWEAEPTYQESGTTQAWGLTRKAMSFMVQTGPLSGDFGELILVMAEQDRAAVGGAIQEPLTISEGQAQYAFFDAESRIQVHRWYRIESQWIKISVLYKPSMASRVTRATAFFANLGY
ncbi:hypothetical protein [Reinekea sp.]|jgi:hypothetical protein|uniref:hypothetical protein n=1 Tax=Reinekea sp. TaxID=1970455 RepID=UPI002A7F66B0|nr:hypothetical protein [Reinekea sp.]